MIKYIRFTNHFDAEKMKQELNTLETGLWRDHYNRNNYEGSWSTIQLRSVNGQLDNNTAIQSSALQGDHTFKDTPLLDHCPYIKEVIGFFKMEKTAVRLMKLDAGAVIKPHSDHCLNFEEGEVRIHIPVITDTQVKFFLEEEQIPMQEGSCWYLNLSLQHSVNNESNTDRVHLVIDGIVNDWLKEYFGDGQHHTIEMEDRSSEVKYSSEDKLKIITQLRLMGTETGDKLADEMQASLQQLNS